jgi:hypothetical protein
LPAAAATLNLFPCNTLFENTRLFSFSSSVMIQLIELLKLALQFQLEIRGIFDRATATAENYQTPACEIPTSRSKENWRWR